MATKKEKKAILKLFKDAEARVMQKVKKRMYELAKDEKLKAQMEQEIKEELCQTHTIKEELERSDNVSTKPVPKVSSRLGVQARTAQ